MNKQEQLERKLAEAQDHIRRLTHTLEKAAQRETKKTLLVQAKILQLEQTNQELLKQLQLLQCQRQRWKKGNSMLQSKIMTKSVGPQHDDQNINTLNTEICKLDQCKKSRKELQQANLLCERIVRQVESLLKAESLRVAESGQQNFEVGRVELERRRQGRKEQAQKDSLSILRRLQGRLKELEDQFIRQPRKKELSDPLATAMRDLRQQKSQLMEIPFLQRIDPKQHKEEVSYFVRDAKNRCNSLLAHLSQL